MYLEYTVKYKKVSVLLSISSKSLGKYGKILRNAIYRVDPFNATYLDCHRDSAKDRDLPIFIGKLHKPMSCMKACSGYKYFGLQYGGESVTVVTSMETMDRC